MIHYARPPYVWALVSLVVTVLSGCIANDPSSQDSGEPVPATKTRTTERAVAEPSRAELGEQHFSQAFPNSNGRSCATCHVPEDNFPLTPAHGEKVWESNPQDPLFSAIVVDDPKVKELAFEHLRKGLVRVWLTLPENMNLINLVGNVNTPLDRKVRWPRFDGHGNT
jgi:hypothetical protein